MEKFEMDRIESDVKPEDQRSKLWADFIAAFGPGPAIWLSDTSGGDKLYIPDYDSVTKEARHRDRNKPTPREDIEVT